MSLSQAKVPTVVGFSILSLAVGIAVGVVAMSTFGYLVGYQWTSRPADEKVEAKGGPGGGMPGKGGPEGGGKGSAKGPGAKAQLMNLIDKLDLLTRKPLSVHLDDEQKKKVRAELQALAKADQVSEDDAKEKLDALLAVLKDQREPLMALGVRWPDAAEAPGPPLALIGMMANPFKQGPVAAHVKAIDDRLK